MKLSVREELRGNRLSLIRAEMRSSSGVPDHKNAFSYELHTKNHRYHLLINTVWDNQNL